MGADNNNQTILILDTPTKTYSLKSGLHLVGNGNENYTDILISDKTIDNIHALFHLTPKTQIIIDLNSENGTYLAEAKTKLFKTIKKTIIQKNGRIKFGDIVCNFKILLSDRGIESSIKNNSRNLSNNASDIIQNSPERENEQPRYLKKFLTNRSLLNSITSTPNQLKIQESSVMEVVNNAEESFFVPETQASRYSIERTNEDSLELNSTDDELSHIEDENIRKQVLIMSKEDEFYVPETQEHFSKSTVEKKSNFKNSVFDDNANDDDDLFRLDTQDFENNSTDEINDDENGSCTSPNLLLSLSKKKNLEYNKHKKTNHKLKLSYNQKTNEKHEDSNDIEMSELNWTERTDKIIHSTNINSNCSTPDDLFKTFNNDEPNSNIVLPDSLPSPIQMPVPFKEEKEEIKEEIKDSISPEPNSSNCSIFLGAEQFLTPLIPEPKKKVTSSKSNEFIRNKVDTSAALSLTQQMDQMFNSQKSEHEVEIIESLEPTQVFINPVLSSSVFKSSKNYNSQRGLESHKSVNLAKDMDDMEPTQVFISPKSIASKQNVIKHGYVRSRNPEATKSYLSDKENDNDEFLEPTQEFINPKSSKKNGKFSNIAFVSEANNYDEDNLTPTQKFVPKDKADQENLENNSGLSFIRTSADLLCSDGPQKAYFPTNQSRKTVYNNEEIDFDILTPQVSFLKLPTVDDLEKVGSDSETKIDGIIDFLDSDSETIELANEIKSTKIENSSNGKTNKKIANEDKSTKSENSSNRKTNKKISIKKIESKNSSKDENQAKDNKRNNDYHFSDSGNENLKLINKIKNAKDDNQVKKNSTKNVKTNNTKNVKTNNKKVEPINPQKNVGPIKANVNKRNRQVKELDNQFIYDLDQLTQNIAEADDVNKKQNSLKAHQSKSKKHIKGADIETSKINKKTTKKRKITENINDSNETYTVPSLRKSARLERKKVSFTRVDVKHYQSIVDQTDAVIVENPRDCDLMIANEILRTCKFLAAIARGVPIISTKWLDDIMATGLLNLAWQSYILKDLDGEKKYNFNLKKSLQKAKNRAIFSDFTFLITPNTKPPPQELKQIIYCGGGKVIDNISLLNNDFNNFYIVSHKKDCKLWSDYKMYSNFPIISTEGIILTVLQQQICFRNYKIA